MPDSITDQRDKLFGQLKAVNDATYTVLVDAQKVYTALASRRLLSCTAH